MNVPAQVFRPAKALRIAATITSLLCLAAAVEVASGISSHQAVLVATDAALLGLPTVLTVALFRRSVTISMQGILNRTLFTSVLIPWPAVKRLDVRGRSFVIQTIHGPVNADWLDRRSREQLASEVVRQARLILDPDTPTDRAIRRYVPRMVDIGFEPHHKRRGS